ncbi:O-antigen ligase family protein [Anoxynatronum sibiricum]|uniref:O-antigen ligase family protein n=1 Tax=Anoxynatronum sibiricum TaxID=210623 RepID=A0ABU9VY04_9CLOT
MKNNDKIINIKFYNLSIVILAILAIIMGLIPSRITAFVFLGAVVFSAFKEPTLAYAGWVMGYAFFSILTDATGILGYFLLTPLILQGVIIQIFKGGKFTIPVPLVVFSISIIIVASFSWLFSRAPQENIMAFAMLLTAIFTMISMVNTIRNYKGAFGAINQAYVFTAIAIFFVTVLSGDFLQVARLNIGDNIRRVANVTTPAIIMLYIEIIFLSKKDKKSIFNNRFPIWLVIFLFLLCLIVLLATASRGAYLGLIVSGFCVFLGNLVLLKAKSKPIKKIILYPLGIGGVWWAIRFVQGSAAGRYMSSFRVSSFGDNARWLIWMGGFVQMKGHEFIIGAGPNSFRQLALLSGYDYNPHSVWFDTFITLGLIGFSIFIIFTLFLLTKSINKRNLYSFGILSLSIGLYSTHGNLTGSMDFWALLALCYGGIIIDELNYKT